MRRSATGSLAIAIVVLVSVFLAVLSPHLVAFLNSEVFHKGEVPLVADPAHGYIEIWAYEKTSNGWAWNRIINTTSVQTAWVPANTTLIVSAKPAYGYEFYAINYSTNLLNQPFQIALVSNMQSIATLTNNAISGSVGAQPGIKVIATGPSKFIAIYPAEIQFSPAYIYDTDYNYLWNITWLGQLTFVANGSPVPNAGSLAQYFSNLYVSGTGEAGGSYSNSFQLRYSSSGNYFFVSNQEVANIGEGNYALGLATKNAYIDFTSPDPFVLASGTVYSASNWGWADTVEFLPGNSEIVYSWQPFSGVTFTGYALPNSTPITYLPTGEVVTLSDSPASGYAFTQWTEFVKNGQNKSIIVTTSTANPWSLQLPTSVPAPNYVYYIQPTIAKTSIEFEIANDVNTQISGELFIYQGSNLYYSTVFTLQAKPPVEIPSSGTYTIVYLSGVPLGNYTWQVEPASGEYIAVGDTFAFQAVPSNGSFTIGSSNPSFYQTVQYESNVKYANVTFTSNLPPGVTWWVDFAGSNVTSTSPSITFYNIPYSASSGAVYSWSAPGEVAENGYVWKTSSTGSTITVTGNTVKSITYTEYAVVNIDVSPGSAGTTNPTQALVQPNTQMSFYFYPNLGWWYQGVSFSPSGAASLVSVSQGKSGNEPNFYITVKVYAPVTITVNARPAHFTVYFADAQTFSSVSSYTYSVQITQSGSVITTASASNSQEIKITGLSANTAYGYTFETAYPQSNIEEVPTGVYQAGPTLGPYSTASGTFKITAWNQNNSLVVSEDYTEYDYISVGASPSGEGTVSPVSGWYQLLSQYTFTATPSSGYYFTGWSTNLEEISSSSNSITIAVNKPGYVDASFAPITLTFKESGLPSGVSWSVTINGPVIATRSSTSNTISFVGIPAGTYSYQIGIVSYGGNLYAPSPASSSVSVSTSASVSVSYTEAYPVTLQVSGSGSISWSQAAGVVVSGSGATSGSTSSSTTVYMSSNAQVELTATAGSGYYFSNWGFSGYVSPAQGYSSRDNPTYAVDTGSSGTITANFAVQTYSVTFSESGLPWSWTWSVTLNGQTQSATNYWPFGGTTITFNEPAGTYYYSIPSQGSYNPSPSSGWVTVPPAQTISVTFTQAVTLYSHTWSEAGLGPGDSATLTVSNSTWSKSYTLSPSQSSVTVKGLTGTMDWSVSDSSDGATPSQSSSSVSSSGTTTISFSYPSPSASISANPSSASTGQSVSFSGLIWGGTGHYSWTLNFGDGSSTSGTGSSVSATHSYSKAGTYTVTLSVTDTVSGLKTSATTKVTVSSPVSVSISASSSSIAVGSSVTFTITFSGGTGSYSWTLNFGDGSSSASGTTSSTQIQVSHTFSSGGAYTVQVSVTSGSATASASTSVTAGYTITFTESGLPTSFAGQTVYWSVTIGGTTKYAKAGNSIVFGYYYGQVSWQANNVYLSSRFGHYTYKPSPSSGNTNVNGNKSISIKYSDPPAYAMPPAWLSYFAVAVLLAVVWLLFDLAKKRLK